MNSFGEIYGHDKIKNHLQNAIELDKISHAYIFNGGLGSGKKSVAQLFAKTLQCEAGKTEPCNECRSCKQTETKNQPDIIWVTHEKDGSIGVDDIREQLIGDIQIKPYSSKYKIYIIDEAEKLTVQAQNAMLKTIEEPPSYGIIILLTTNADIFLQTIISRCVKLDFKPVSDELVIKYLQDNFNVTNHEQRFAAAFAQGNIGRAVSIVTSSEFGYLQDNFNVTNHEQRFAAAFAQGNIGRAVSIVTSSEFGRLKDDVMHVIRYVKDMSVSEIISEIKNVSNYKLTIDDYLDLMAMWFRRYVKDMSVSEIISEIKNVSNYKLTIDDYLDLMAMWFRDVLIFKSTNDTNHLIFSEEISLIKEQAVASSYEGLENILKAIDKVKIRLKANVNFELVIELLVMTIQEAL